MYSPLYFVDEFRSQGLTHPEIPIATGSKRMSSFSINGTLQLRNSVFIDTTCTNTSCDSLEMRKGGVSMAHCACWKVQHRVSSVVLCLSIKVFCQGECNPGHDFMVKDFTSRNFSSNFITGEIPPGVTAAMIIGTNYLRREMRVNVKRFINLVNANGGWNIQGWIKPALQTDRGTVDSSSAGNAHNNPSQHSMVPSSNLIYHLTSVRIADQNMDPNVRHQLDALRMNVTNLEGLGRVAPPNAGVAAHANLAAAGALGPVNAGAVGPNLAANVDGAPIEEGPVNGGADVNEGPPQQPVAGPLVGDDLD